MNDSHKKCVLCLSKPADKTGSHIIPFFLVKPTINQEGKTQRDFEIMHDIGGPDPSVYVGRKVSQEKVNEVVDTEDYEKFIEENQNALVIDYLLCSDCEKRLHIVEDLYASEGLKFVKNGDETFSNCESVAACVFWASVVWRISISKRFGRFQLTPKACSKIRRLLDKVLSTDKKIFIANCGSTPIDDLPRYILLVGPKLEHSSRNVIFAHPKHIMPHCFSLGEYCLFFYHLQPTFKETKQEYFGLEEFILQSKPNPKLGKKEALIHLPEDIWDNSLKRIHDWNAKQFQQKRIDFIRESYFALVREPAPDDLVHRILQRVKEESNSEKAGDKYSLEQFTKIAIQEIAQFLDIKQ